MKKKVIAYLLILLVGAQLLVQFEYMKADAKEALVIPDEAIRLRILANSDSKEDQELKRKVRDEVKAQIDGWVEDLTSFEEARHVIKSHIPELEQIVAKTLEREGSNETFQVEFGKQVKFPTKMYGNFIYPAGEYEAVLITIGEGEGANWWCVLFPPMCFLDFSSGTAVQAEENTEEKVVEDKIGDKKIEVAEEEKEEEEVVSKESEKTDEANTVKETNRVFEKEEENTEEKLQKDDGEKVEKKEKQEKQEKKIEVKEEEETEVRLFVVDAFSSMFSK